MKADQYSESVASSTVFNVVDVIRANVQSNPGSPAFVSLKDGEVEDSGLSYVELDRRARAIAVAIKAKAGSGDRVVLFYSPGLAFVTNFFGCLYAGTVAVPVPLPKEKSANQIRTVVQNSKAKLGLGEGSAVSRIKQLCRGSSDIASLDFLCTEEISSDLADRWSTPSLTADSLALLQYTSGSTATPRGVMVTHRNLLWNEQMIRGAFEVSPQSIIVSWLPPYHDMGLIGGLIQPAFAGAQCILMSPTSFLQRPVRWLRTISKYRATISGGPNFAYELCLRRISKDQRHDLDLSSWRTAFNGAEPVRADTLRQFTNLFAVNGFRQEAFYPCYGLAEATLLVTGGLIAKPAPVLPLAAEELCRNIVKIVPDVDQRRKSHLVGCGCALGGQQVAIVNAETRIRCEDGQIGEVWIAGASVTRGYWDAPQQTNDVFHVYLADTAEGPFLRTGDLGFVHNGELFITGRSKDVVIVRGKNHYPHDIELTVRRAHPSLQSGLGAAFSVHEGGEEHLVIVQEIASGCDADSVPIFDKVEKELLEHHGLQAHAVLLVRLGSVPKTSSGKVQRYLCREAYLDGQLEPQYIRQHSDEQKTARLEAGPSEPHDLRTQIAAKLSRYLKVDFSAFDFEVPLVRYGLDSLTAIELTHNLECELGVSFAVSDILHDLTARQLVEKIEAQVKSAEVPAKVPKQFHAEPARKFPLSLGQQALWFLAQLHPDSSAYNIPCCFRVGSAVDLPMLRKSFSALMAQHASLRTRIVCQDTHRFQEVYDNPALCFQEIDASFLSHDEVMRCLQNEANRPFNVEAGPLIRVLVLTRSIREHLILVTVHHLVADLWSMLILIYELGLLYAANLRGEPPRLADSGPSYADFVQQQMDMLNGNEGERLLSYWRESLEGAPSACHLPYDHVPPTIPAHGCKHYQLRIAQPLAQKLKKLAKQQGITLYMLLLAGFEILLHRYSADQEVLVGSPTSGRNQAAWTNVVGYFVNPVVLRANFTDDPELSCFLSQVQENVLAALRHQEYPFGLLVEKLLLERSSNLSPFFQVMFVWHKFHLPQSKELGAMVGEADGELRLGDLAIEPVTLYPQMSEFGLTLTVIESDSSITATLQYHSHLFDASSIQRMGGHWQELMTRMVSGMQRKVGALPLLTEREFQQVVTEWNNTEAEYPRTKNLMDLFQDQVLQTPKDPALTDGNRALTYEQLNRYANQLGRYLQKKGVRSEGLVAILLERSVDLIVSIFGVLKSGAAYVPLDPEYPLERIKFILQDTHAPVLLTQHSFLPKLKQNVPATLICLDEEWKSIQEQMPAENLQNTAHSENLAYVLYTSGSTGQPKGVALEHGGAVALITWATRSYSRADLASVLASTSICFDLSIFELFAPLSCGGKVVLVRDALNGLNVFSNTNVTLVNSVPSVLAEMLSLNLIPASVRTINLAGEPLSSVQVDRIYESTNTQRVFDLYGPSECSTYSTRALRRKGERDTIGKPILNTVVYIVDRAINPVSVGVVGEIYIGGAGVARGYWERPALTAEKFVPDPFGGDGRRLYRTGDLGRYRTDGSIEYVGRIDTQVKLRGYRIELGEIEAALIQHEAVDKAVVVLTHNDGRGGRLVAYFVAKNRIAIEELELRNLLKASLPKHMIPTEFIKLSALPLNPNGKIARGCLPLPTNLPGNGEAYVRPRTLLEKQLVAIWTEVLGRGSVGIDDNFFEIGGHSLLATQVVSRLRRVLGLELPLQMFFEVPTIRGLAAHLSAYETTASATEAIADQAITATDKAAYRTFVAQRYGQILTK